MPEPTAREALCAFADHLKRLADDVDAGDLGTGLEIGATLARQRAREIAAAMEGPGSGTGEGPPVPESHGDLNASERDAVMAGLGLLLEALGLGDYARPESPHEVMLQCIAEVKRLRAGDSAFLTERPEDTLRRYARRERDR